MVDVFLNLSKLHHTDSITYFSIRYDKYLHTYLDVVGEKYPTNR